jgi:hypothetical protein
LNSGAPVEFGQGVAQATACDDSVVVTPSSTFVNSAESAGFTFSSFSVTDISSACNGKIFTIKAYKNGQSNPLDLYSTTGVTDPFNEIQVLDSAGSFSLVEAGLLSDDIQDISTGFNVNLSTREVPVSTAVASAQDVDRITIESKDSNNFIAAYSVGETGPGSGIIYYVDAGDGFECGPQHNDTGSPTGGKCHYLEVAPSGWSGGANDPFSQWAIPVNWYSDAVGVENDNSQPFNDRMAIGLV